MPRRSKEKDKKEDREEKKYEEVVDKKVSRVQRTGTRGWSNYADQDTGSDRGGRERSERKERGEIEKFRP